jgi:hypothetical protein
MKASSILSTLVMTYLVGSAPIQQIQAVQPTANQQTLLAGKVENNHVGDIKAVDGDGKSSKYMNMGMMNPYMNMMYGGMGMMGMMNPYLGMGMGY